MQINRFINKITKLIAMYGGAKIIDGPKLDEEKGEKKLDLIYF